MSGSDISVHSRSIVPPHPETPARGTSVHESERHGPEQADRVESHEPTPAAHSAPRSTALPYGPSHPADAVSLRHTARDSIAPQRAARPARVDFAAAVAEAKAKGLAQLTKEVGRSAHFSRTIVSRMTLAGLGIAMGLLFAGQPLAVIFVVPAMAAIGIGLRYVTRRRLNDGTKPHIEAFKALMAEADEATQASPEYARALKLYRFLGGKQANTEPSQAQAHLSDAYSDVASSWHAGYTGQAWPLVPMNPEDGDGFDEHTLSEANMQRLHAQTPESLTPPLQKFERGEAEDGVPENRAPRRTPNASFSSSFPNHEAHIAAWHTAHPGVDPTRSFDERDIASYDEITQTIRTLPGASLVPTWSLDDRVFKALGLELADRNTLFTASELRVRLGLGVGTQASSTLLIEPSKLV